jgi:TolB-like protein
MVIARNSSFAYKGKTFDIRTVGRELGVRSVLEGSIRRAGNRVRITAQLINAETGGISGRTATIASSPIFSRCRTKSRATSSMPSR